MSLLSKYYVDSWSGWHLKTSPGPQSLVALFLLITGGLLVASQIWTFLRVLLSLFVLPGKSLRSFGSKGSWALVTGASDGIGKEFALQLARAGFNLLLVSRTEEKLSALADEISSKNPAVQTKRLAMDFARNDDEDHEKLKALVDELDIAVLVNNVGKSHDMPVPFVLTPENELTDIVYINCLGTLRVTQLVAPGMVQRRRGLILTMGSFGGLVPTPLLATYSGSKAFLQYWSTALGSELEPYGIQVELVQAHLITSAMSKIRKPTATVPTPRTFVKSVLSKIGRHGGSPGYTFSSSPYWSHGLIAWFLTCVMGVMSKTFLSFNKDMHESIRKRALRKAEREKGKKAE